DGSVALADRLIGLGGAYAASPEALLGRVLASTMREGVADHVISHSLLHPTIVFDTFTTARMAGVRPHLSRVFEAVLYPRQAFGSPRPGDLLVRRAHGEPGVGHIAFVASHETWSRDEAHRRGLRLESSRPGVYVQVVEAGAFPHRVADRFARRIGTADGSIPGDTLVLRPRMSIYRAAEAVSAPAIDVDRAVRANRQYAAQLGWNASADRIDALLGLRQDAAPEDVAQAVASWQADHSLAVDGIIGPDTWAAMQPLLDGADGGGSAASFAGGAGAAAGTDAADGATAAIGTSAFVGTGATVGGGATGTQAAPRAPRPLFAGATTRQDGIDVYSGNRMPAWNDLRAAGIAYVIHKCSEGGGITDGQFATRYPAIRSNGFIRGAYHYYRHTNGVGGDVQGDQVVTAVQRLAPGDLAPSLDFE